MDFNINDMILLSYAINKHNKKKHTRKFKLILPRKKSSPRRIGINYHWNKLEEMRQRKHEMSSSLNFDNEINDNILNEFRERHVKYQKLTGMSAQARDQMEAQSYTTGPTCNLLTPPPTPQIGNAPFVFGSKHSIIKEHLDPKDQGSPLTPSDLDVFTY